MTSRKYFARNEWTDRVDPAFVRYWIATKRMWALALLRGSQKGDEDYQRNELELAAASRKLLPDPSAISSRVWPAIFAGLDGEGIFMGSEPNTAYITNPESSGLFRELVFLRYGITFRELMVDIEMNPNSHLKLIKVHHDFRRFRAGERTLSGLKLKFNLTHFQVMLQGLDFGFLKLNELELRECFDQICPCAQRHSVEYMKKFRTRVKKAADRVIASTDRPTSFHQT